MMKLHISQVILLMFIPSSYEFSPTTNGKRQRQTHRFVITETQVLRRNQGTLVSPSKVIRENSKDKMIQHIEGGSLNNAKYHGYNVALDTEGFGAVLLNDGVVRVDQVLSAQTTKNMLRYTNQLLLESLNEVILDEREASKLFGNVHMNTNRFDLLLPLEESDNVMACLSELLHDDSRILHSLQSILGKDAELFELSVMISDPGSEAQPLHPDILYQDTLPPILTCFVALQDVSSDMGPTLFMPGSATFEHHQDLRNRHLDPHATGLVATSYNVLSTLSAGDCSLYDTMILHLGSSNTSCNRRCLFYFSFKNNHVFKEGCRSGSSIRPSVKDRHLTLNDIRHKIHEWREVSTMSQ
jgi:ectoine hydroxylase-related dioxygenase (phytanoyl-CoA dioxygenase family)